VGLAQDWEKLVKTARETAWNEKITYSVYGDGAFSGELNRLIAQAGLTNIKCYGMVPKDQIGEILGAHDLAYAHLKDSPVLHTALLNKLVMYMGWSMPVIAGLAGYTAKMLTGTECAFVTAPGDYHQVAGILLGLQKSGEMGETLREMGEKGYAYAREHFRWDNYKDILAREIERVLSHE
jgi:glycosyltransferase involved in cell wall biosynthesis